MKLSFLQAFPRPLLDPGCCLRGKPCEPSLSPEEITAAPSSAEGPGRHFQPDRGQGNKGQKLTEREGEIWRGLGPWNVPWTISLASFLAQDSITL